jgi:hypothetical protein
MPGLDSKCFLIKIIECIDRLDEGCERKKQMMGTKIFTWATLRKKFLLTQVGDGW